MLMLNEAAKQFNIDLTSGQVQSFNRYMELLLEYNQKFNLTAITIPDEINLKHFLDCMACAEHIPNGAVIADIGSGAGFPGMVVKIVRPDVKIVLMDSLNKRIGFLKTVAAELDLSDVECLHIRAEDAGRDATLREHFDIVLSRAVANMSVLAEYCLPLVKTGGSMIAMKGRDVADELSSAKSLISKLGGKAEQIFEYDLADGEIHHSIVKIVKQSVTPKAYPRKGKKIGT